jgi:hypothetical protein
MNLKRVKSCFMFLSIMLTKIASFSAQGRVFYKISLLNTSRHDAKQALKI